MAGQRILEIGFGRGLNFLSASQAAAGSLHYAAIVTEPQLASRWSGLTPGFHRFVHESGRVLLTLCVGDPARMLRELDFPADEVLLNLDADLRMLNAISRLCREGSTLAAASSTDQMRLELATCGFVLESGAPLRARFAPSWKIKGLRRAAPAASHCIVIGAGLAGAAVAASLARRGWQVEVLDSAAHPAAGASALPVGLLAPHQSPDDNLLSRLTRAGVRITLQECEARLAQDEWSLCGALESRGDDARPVPDVPGLEPWTREATARECAAAGLEGPAWWHANAAWIKPAALAKAWLTEPGTRFRGNCAVARLERHDTVWHLRDAAGALIAEASLVVVAGAHASGALLHGRITTHPVRGQVSWALGGVAVPFPINGNGHFIPNVPTPDGLAWFTGSTYGRGDTDTAARDSDQHANVQRLRELLPALGKTFAPTRAWSGVRCTSADRRPLVGEVEPGLWVSTAMGSRGLTFAALGAELIAARLHGEPLPLELRLARLLDVR